MFKKLLDFLFNRQGHSLPDDRLVLMEERVTERVEKDRARLQALKDEQARITAGDTIDMMKAKFAAGRIESAEETLASDLKTLEVIQRARSVREMIDDINKNGDSP